jgi:hypothetical protein
VFASDIGAEGSYFAGLLLCRCAVAWGSEQGLHVAIRHPRRYWRRCPCLCTCVNCPRAGRCATDPPGRSRKSRAALARCRAAAGEGDQRAEAARGARVRGCGWLIMDCLSVQPKSTYSRGPVTDQRPTALCIPDLLHATTRQSRTHAPNTTRAHARTHVHHRYQHGVREGQAAGLSAAATAAATAGVLSEEAEEKVRLGMLLCL